MRLRRLVNNATEETYIDIEATGVLGNVSFNIFTLLGLGLGILVGIILKQAAPEAVSGAISDNIFSPVYTMFMSALKLIVGPLVFCSVASSIADFGDLKALGRIALKIVGMYLITSMIAFFVGLGSYSLFSIGNRSSG